MPSSAPPRPPSSAGSAIAAFGARVAAIVAVGVVLGAADSWRRPIQLHLAPNPPGDGGAAIITATPGVDEVNLTIEQAKALFDQGVPFIDARPDAEFGVSRVQGAFHVLPHETSSPAAQDVIALLDPSALVVIYCGGGDCHDSESLAIRLQQMGFTSLRIMRDGFPAWEAAGLPIEKGG